jgi:alkylhydroperoxidase/carboxymuconolactone decarboxylase family protein YurZ
MLCALNRGAELAVHVRGGVNNGLTEMEIREALLLDHMEPQHTSVTNSCIGLVKKEAEDKDRFT